MAKLIYSAIASLDGYVEDVEGNFDWGAPDEEVFAFINDLERPIGTYLYGRRMYETMLYWESAHTLPDQSPAEVAFTTIWQAAQKIVYSRTLDEVSSAKTKLLGDFVTDDVRQLKETSNLDLTIAGAELAALAIEAGLVDEVHLFLTPLIVGGGKAALPTTVARALRLINVQRFERGAVHLHYELIRQ